MACSLQAEDSNRFKTMVAFDCRGVEPVDFSPRVSHLSTAFVKRHRLGKSHDFVVSLTISWPISHSHKLTTDFPYVTHLSLLFPALGSESLIFCLLGVSKSEIASEILLTSCPLTVVCPQGGFVAEGVDTGTKFTDVNLTEKVHNFNQSWQAS